MNENYYINHYIKNIEKCREYFQREKERECEERECEKVGGKAVFFLVFFSDQSDVSYLNHYTACRCPLRATPAFRLITKKLVPSACYTSYFTFSEIHKLLLPPFLFPYVGGALSAVYMR